MCQTENASKQIADPSINQKKTTFYFLSNSKVHESVFEWFLTPKTNKKTSNTRFF